MARNNKLWLDDLVNRYGLSNQGHIVSNIHDGQVTLLTTNTPTHSNIQVTSRGRNSTGYASMTNSGMLNVPRYIKNENKNLK